MRRNVPYGHPDFGKAVECSCHYLQRKEREQQQLLALSQLDTLERLKDATFDSYDVTMPDVRDAFNAAYKFATRPKGWLVLAGPNGCGKTHLAAAVGKERLENRETVLFQPVPDLLDHLRSAFAPSAEQSYEALFHQIRVSDLLILDDLGAQQSTPWAKEKLFQLLNHRYNAMLPTMITTNCMYLQGIEERVVSRLRDRILVKMVTMEQAIDYRPTQQDGEEQDQILQ
jgi:DNA replication protein DnaC